MATTVWNLVKGCIVDGKLIECSECINIAGDTECVEITNNSAILLEKVYRKCATKGCDGLMHMTNEMLKQSCDICGTVYTKQDYFALELNMPL